MAGLINWFMEWAHLFLLIAACCTGLYFMWVDWE